MNVNCETGGLTLSSWKEDQMNEMLRQLKDQLAEIEACRITACGFEKKILDDMYESIKQQIRNVERKRLAA